MDGDLGMSLPPLKQVITADTTQFNTAIDGAMGALKRFAGPAGVIAAVTGLAALTKSAINTADEMTKASQRIGVGVGELSRLKHAAELSGVSFQGLQSSIGILNRNLANVSGGGNAATTALAKMGIESRNTDGTLKGTTQIMSEMADLFKDMPDGAEKSALAMAVFGRSGADLVPMLNQGSDAIREMMNEADELGIVIDEQTGRRAEQFNDNLKKLGDVVKGLGTQLAAELLPVLVEVTKVMVEVGKAFIEGVKYAMDVVRGFGVLIDTMAPVVNWSVEFKKRFDDAAQALRSFLNFLLPIINPLSTVLGMLGKLGAARRELEGNQDAWGGPGSWRSLGFSGSAPSAPVETGGSSGGSRSGGGGRSVAVKEERDTTEQIMREYERRAEALERSLMTQEERLSAWYAEGQKTLDEAFANNIISQEKFNEQRARLDAEYAEKLAVMNSDGFEKRMEQLDEEFKTEEERLLEWYELRGQLLEDALEREFITEEEYLEKKLRLQEEYSRRTMDLMAQEEQFRRSTLTSMLGMLSNFGSRNKALAIAATAVNAAQRISEITANTAAASVRALAELGPIAGPPAAAKIKAYGKVQAGIAAASAALRIGAGGGGGGGAVGSLTGGGSVAANDTAQPVTAFRFTLTNDPMGFGEQFARQMVDQINQASRDGGRVVASFG
jgi:hypothetical protein